ncbi:LTA synthase family protein [Cohnella pontilimi]|uniref:LTA synthase family protein n=1 Tax=Cohnella pontilimi TaxID=2564100 RepID=A0A4U0FI40_9BACL|nr:LTA synthase family protein [Cohnella pontilimi]TJY44620.1 LTA synthase family protein [Cohnella pontilimi]
MLSKIKWPQPFFVLTVILLLKVMLLRYFIFEEIAWGRLFSDAASLLFIVCLFELITPDRMKKYVFWFVDLVVSLLFFSSTLYFQYFGTVPTYTALNELKQVAGVKDSVKATIQFSNYAFFIDVAFAALVWIVVRIARVRLPQRRPASRAWNLGIAAVALVGLAASTMFIREGKSIQNELAQAEDVGFFNFQVAAALKAKQTANIDTTKVSQQIVQLQSQEPDLKTNAAAPVAFGSAKGKNLIIIQMEAFQNFPIHLKVNGQVITPVLNALAEEGYYFPHFFQQIGQGNTSDAEFMSNTSIYPTAKVAMSTGYSDRALPSLPKLLQKYGYQTATFHVNNITFWDRDKMYPALGFNKWYDKPSFKNDHFNGFGASDEELYRVGVSKMLESKKANKPFYFQFVTASSHHPFKIPADKQWLKLPASIKGTQLGDYLQAVHYTDYAVGQLVKQLKANGLYDNTMIVFYGDHFGLQPKDNPPEDVSAKLGITYHERISRFNIPLIIRMPGTAPHKVVKTVGGQVDIMPTVTNLLGISLQDEKYSAFGHDLLNTEKNLFGMRYYLPTGSFFNNEVMFVPGKTFEDGAAVSLDTLKPVTDISKYKSDYDYVLKLMQLSDQYVESLPARK